MLHTFLNFLTTKAIRSSKLSIDVKKTTFQLFCVNHIHLNSLISYAMTQALTPSEGVKCLASCSVTAFNLLLFALLLP